MSEDKTHWIKSIPIKNYPLALGCYTQAVSNLHHEFPSLHYSDMSNKPKSERDPFFEDIIVSLSSQYDCFPDPTNKNVFFVEYLKQKYKIQLLYENRFKISSTSARTEHVFFINASSYHDDVLNIARKIKHATWLHLGTKDQIIGNIWFSSGNQPCIHSNDEKYVYQISMVLDKCYLCAVDEKSTTSVMHALGATDVTESAIDRIRKIVSNNSKPKTQVQEIKPHRNFIY